MAGKRFEEGVVSWTTFEALVELHHDLNRKLHLFVRAGHALGKEGLALESIADLLAAKGAELQELSRRALSEREAAGGTGVEVVLRQEEPATSAGTIAQRDRAVFGKLLEISRSGGHAWENIRAIIEGTYASLEESGELKS